MKPKPVINNNLNVLLVAELLSDAADAERRAGSGVTKQSVTIIHCEMTAWREPPANNDRVAMKRNKMPVK